MENKKEETFANLYFYTSMPEIHLEYKNEMFMYEYAFHRRDDKNDCKYCLNTTTWD